MPHDIDQIMTRLSPGKFDAQRAANFDLERAKGALESSFSVERMVNFDEETRTAEFSFGTDEPIEHWFGTLQLDTSAKAVVLDRVKAGVAPFLVNHQTSQHVGVVVKDSIELGPKIRGKAKFSRSQIGEDAFVDVKDEIRVGTSLGFLVHDMQLMNEKEVRKGAVPMYKATKWEILEVSLASIPADIGCGSTRSFEKAAEIPTGDPEQILEAPSQRAISTQEKIMAKEHEIPEAPVETRTAEQITLDREKTIVEWAGIFGDEGKEIARGLIAQNGNVSQEDVRIAIKAERDKKPPVKLPIENPLAIAARQNGDGVSDAQLATISYRGGALKSFKGEKHLERAYRTGMFLLAVLGGSHKARTFCEEKGLIRAHSGELNSTGGVLVPDEFDQTIIDLRIQYGVFRRNANVSVMSSDTKVQPRRTGGLTPYFTGGGDAATESTKNWDSITLVAKKLSVLTKYENELSEDAVINIADDLASEIAYAFSKKEDECGFNGDGSSTYGGMIGVRSKLLGLSATRANISGLKVAATGHNLWSEIDLADVQGVVAILPQFARMSGNVKWYCSHEFYATVLMRLAQAVGGVTATEIQNGFGPSFFGVPVEIVEVMPHTEANDQVCLLYGNLAQAATLGDRRGTTIAMSDSDGTDFAKGIMAIRGDTRFDINVHDVGNATATAADRAPGPIVGLLTAAS